MRLIRLNVEEGLAVEAVAAKEFDDAYKAVADYPVERAARLYAGYSRTIGATEEAMAELAALTTISREEITMATAKKQTAAPIKKPTNVAKKNEDATHQAALLTGTKKETLPANSKAGKGAPAKTAATKQPAAKPAAGKAPAKPAPKTKAATSSEGTAAEMFRELIRAGKQTDDEIFAKVQKAFGLDDKKRGYVGWYRNDMRKKGEKVPDAKK